MGYIGLIAFFIVAALLLVWISNAYPDAEQKFVREIYNRESVSDSEMISRYFAGDDISPDVPIQVRQALASQTGYPADKLLPDDDLAFFADEFDTIPLVRELESRFGITIADEDSERTACNIRAISLLIASNAGLANRSN